MATRYNIELEVAPNTGRIPAHLYDPSVRKFEEAGILGRKHVNHFGRVLEGYDKHCRIFHRGAFEIAWFENETRNLRQIIEEEEIKTSGFDDLNQQTLEMMKDVLPVLEKHDPLVSLPFNTYSSIPMVRSFEIHTPCGSQGAHAHLKNGEIIQFWKPEKDKFWYDRDSLRMYYEQTLSRISHWLSEDDFTLWDSIKDNLYSLIFFHLGKRKKLIEHSMKGYPDDIKKIPWISWL